MRSIVLVSLVLLCTRSVGQTGLLSTEYFWDADPGQGNGIALVAVDGSYDQALEMVLAETAALPSSGEHTFSVRAHDLAGNWGPVFSTVIQVLPGSVNFPDIQVSEGEYYWDTDPGEGNGSPMFALDGNYNDALEAIGADITQLPASGMHVLGMRILDVNGNWSDPFRVVVEVLSGSVTFPEVHISAAEYWFDTDPGEGSGALMLAADGAFDNSLEDIKGSTIPVPVIAGVNVLWMRAQDDDGGWGPPFGIVVNMDTTITGTVSVPDKAADTPTMIIAPNPTTSADGFRIDMGQHAEAVRVVVLDSHGRVVQDHSYGARSRVDVPMDGYAPGLYPVGVFRGEAVSWHSVVVR